MGTNRVSTGYLLAVLSMLGQAMLSASLFANTSEYDTSCEIVIVGAGAGGMHTAYRLADTFGEKLCVFEKQERVGGRFYDVAISPKAEALGEVIGNGARRIMEGQSVLFDLASELGIEYEAPLTGADVIFAKGIYATDKDDFFALYPGLPVSASDDGYEDQLIQKLLDSKLRESIDSFESFKDYALAVVGDIGYSYLHDMSRFRGDFEYPISARSYVDWLEEELTYCCQTYYPYGGMSSFTKRMYEKILASKSRVFLGTAVESVSKDGSIYVIKTPKMQFAAKKVVIAVPPLALNKISGSIAEQIRSSEHFKSILPIRVTVINQWYDTAWWRGIQTKDGLQLWRAYTTVDKNRLDGRCIGFVEFPPESVAIKQKAIRAVYNDQKECAQMWADIERQGDYEKRDALIRQGLSYLLEDNGVTTPVEIPKALKTTYWEWADAWHWLAAGSKYSNQDIFNWAIEPIAGENVSLVGEAYNPQRSTWSDAAFKSSMHLLEKKF